MTDATKPASDRFGVPCTPQASAEYEAGVREVLGALIGKLASLGAIEGPVEVFDVAHGNLCVISAVLIGALVGRSVLDADDMLPGLARGAQFWRERGHEYRARPAELLSDALKQMSEIKRDVAATLIASRTAAASTMARRH